MYTPPTKGNWCFQRIKYDKKYTTAYQQGYDDGKLRKSLYDNPYAREDYTWYFYYLGWSHYQEFNCDTETDNVNT